MLRFLLFYFQEISQEYHQGRTQYLFSSLLNSENPYYITGAQAQGALVVNKYDIEAIPTGYLIIGDGSTAWFIGQAKSIPVNKSNIAVMYALSSSVYGHAISIS